jgi:hypothetical protein
MLPDSEQKVLQKHLAQFLISDVYNTITGDDILKVRGPNVWEHKGHPLTEGQVKALRAEAKALRESGIWKILRAELLWLAQKGYKKSTGEADLVSVKILELLVKTIDEKLDEMIKI